MWLICAPWRACEFRWQTARFGAPPSAAWITHQRKGRYDCAGGHDGPGANYRSSANHRAVKDRGLRAGCDYKGGPLSGKR
eukprot:scaffold2740_cov130-Isochrysis_galbana.AAC.3